MTDSNHSLVCQNKDGYAVVSFPKELARAHLADIREAGEKIIEDLTAMKMQHCLIDLSELDYIGSSLVASIVRIWKTISERDGQMVVVATNLGTREVLKVTGLNKVWTIAPSVEAGVHALGFSKEAKVEKRERRILVMVGALSLVCGIVAVAFRTLPQFAEMVHPANILVYAILGLSLITSGISIFREKGWRLGMTITVFLICLPLLGFFAWQNEYRAPVFNIPADPAEDSESGEPRGGDTFFSPDSEDVSAKSTPETTGTPSSPAPVSRSVTSPDSQGSNNSAANQSQPPPSDSADSESNTNEAPGDEP